MTFLFILLLTLPAAAQFSDSFTDGNFTALPSWSGNASSFAVEHGQLRLRDTTSSTSAYLSTPSKAIDDAVWIFSLMFDFNPSGSNYARIYLVSDQPNLYADLNGYFVVVGGTKDEVSLFRQDGAAKTKIIDGEDDRTDLSPLNVTIRVTRDKKGNWQLFSDVNSTGAFALEGNASDFTFVSSAYFGISCRYTSTRSDKFFFDNFVVTGTAYRDSIAPTIQSVEVVSDRELLLFFDEPLDSTSAGAAINYMVSDGVGLPATAEWLPGLTAVKLTFANTFKNGLYHTLALSEVMDVNGNTLVDTSLTFFYINSVPARYKDVIMTEIYARPASQSNLPNAEFVELHNRTNNPFELVGWSLSDGNTTATLPEAIILPGQYRVVTSSVNVSTFRLTPEPIGVASFPTLNNDEDMLILKNPSGQTVDSVHYTSLWYRNTEKQEGGWSLELIDPNNSCGEENNWTASESQRGGTPGAPNAVLADKPDLLGPKLVAVTVLAGDLMLLTFDERLESPLRRSVSFVFDPALTISEYQLESPSLRTVSIRLRTPLQRKTTYRLTVTDVFDCNGNEQHGDFSQYDFGVPEPAGIHDVVINEILFNSRPGGVDFVEVYNNTAAYIDMKNWAFANVDNGQITNSKAISKQTSIIRPHAYRVFTPDPNILHDHYPQGKRQTFVSISLPPFPDREGTVALLNADGMLIDRMSYKESLHSPFLSDAEGVSLERISFSATADNAENWRSASSVSGFATPGFVNSNARPQGSLLNGRVTVEPPSFVPYSGVNDFAKINFRFAQTGLVATVKIMDHHGRVIKTIANNELLGVDGFFRWEGDQEDGSRARVGYYYVAFEVFAYDGRVELLRNRVIVAAP